MELTEKLEILANSAKYDASCASSGSDRKGGAIGSAHISGICHSWSSDGRCVSLLKILLTNICEYDCAYCVNRKSNNIKRTAFSAEEICKLTLEFYKRNYIEGLFLSSAVLKNPDFTMELMIKAVKKLRKEYNFSGYVHFKVIPGADLKLVREASLYADRISVNIELPDHKSLERLCPEKNKESVFKPMKYAADLIMESKKSKFLKLAPAGQSTQLIVGADENSDYKILNLSQWLYKKIYLKRVYYSGFVKVNSDNRLPAIKDPPLIREHRLYQADWLLRFYEFKANELLDENENLNLSLDPKTAWALKNMDRFPVEINKADYQTLLRVPGIGIISAKKIIKARKFTNITLGGLKNMGISLKKAIYFITLNGKYYGIGTDNKEKLENLLLEYKQPELFEIKDLSKTWLSANTGNL
ncbi:MAG: putative DNA modification/repair radical SAM protein [Elusimicrobia bacterium]|nr:putative DNA modification/repair radical SAM protein [Elusimicrobiota bacterium]